MPFLGIRTTIWSVLGRQHKSSHVLFLECQILFFEIILGWSMHWGEKNGGWQFGGSRQDREKWKLHDLIRCPRLKTFIPPDPVRFKGNCQCTVHQLGSSSSFRKYMSSCKSSRKTQIDSWDPLIKKKDQQFNAMDVCGVRSAFYEEKKHWPSMHCAMLWDEV